MSSAQTQKTDAINAIEIKQLRFAYGDQNILDIPELTVRRGEMAFLFGPSGSGKSTLLELLAGVLKSQAGEVSVSGERLDQMSDSALDRYRAEYVGYIFQSFNLVPYLSVLENIQLPFLFKKTNQTNEELLHLVQQLGLEPYLHKSVSELSVGQQQRVAVARALIKKPQIILADEPTSALDYDHREKFLKILFELCREHKITVLFVSHDRTIERLFDRSISLLEYNRVAFKSGEVAT